MRFPVARVTAIAMPGCGLEAALVAQERAPDELVTDFAASPPGDADWIWLLDGTAMPRPDCLARLLAALERLPLVPRLLASRIVGPDGTLADAHAPIAPQDETAVAIETVTARVLHVRAVTGASLLLRPADARVAGAGPPATMAWTAALLRDKGGGFLVPDSIAEARRPDLSRTERAGLARRLLLGDALSGRERLRFAAELAEHAPRRR
jgi:hypothetical protein